MKRLSSITALIIASAMLLSACGSHKPPHIEITETDHRSEEDVPGLTDPGLPDATLIAPEETTEATVPAVEAVSPATADRYPTGFMANENIRTDVYTAQRGDMTAGFYMPKLRADSEDAEIINNEISDLTNSLTGNEECIGADFIYFRNTDLIFSILITAHMSDGSCSYRCYTFDTTEGTRLTNEEILELAGIEEDDFYTLAADAVIGFISSGYGSTDIFSPEGLNADSPLGQAVAASDAVAEAYSRTFSSENLNTNMSIFPDSDLGLCYIADIVSADDETTFRHAITHTGKEIASTPTSLMAGDECLADINFDNMCEYLKLTGDGYVTAYTITGDTLTEITTIPSADLSYGTSYIYEQSGYIGTRVLRAGLMNDPSNLSYELIILSSECEIISDITISWSDSNGDGQITEDDAFTRDGEITSFAEWFDLTGIS